jgi:hypothetical protein
MPIDYSKFDVKSAVHTGGVTGSKRVTMLGKPYQLKPSIKDNNFIRRFKAGGTDRENYGEVIAAKIARSILMNEDFEAAPDVMLVYDKERKKTPIASKYLEGDKVRNLDEFIQEKGQITLIGKKHARFIDGSKKTGGIGLKEREYDIGGEENTDLRKDISRGIVGSIIIGDHDINPGNFIVVTKDGKDRVARIDFGHAFNDLLNAPKFFGGQVRNKDNRVLDFFNRENIAGLTKSNSQSKLWRDYPGMIPTQEMVDALKEVSQSTKLQQGIENTKKEFDELLSEMGSSNDENGMKHLKKSLNAISSNIGFKLDPKLTPEKTIEAALSNMATFAKQNQKQMQDVSKLMQMQVDVDKIIDGKKNGKQPTKEQIDQIKLTYDELRNAQGIAQKNGKLEWIKTSAEKPAHKGGIESYIKQRGEELGLSKENSKALAHNDFQLPKEPSFFEKIFEKIFGNKQKAAVEKVVSDPEIKMMVHPSQGQEPRHLSAAELPKIHQLKSIIKVIHNAFTSRAYKGIKAIRETDQEKGR